MTKRKIRIMILSLSMIILVTAATLYYGERLDGYATAGAEIGATTGEDSRDEGSEQRALPTRFDAPAGFSSTALKPFLSDASQRPDWADLEVSERVALSDIPADQRAGMSTDDLILSVLNYDFSGNILTSSISMQHGFDGVREHYRGLQALLERPDAASRLVALYQSIDLETWYEMDESAPLIKTYLELLLSQDEIVGALTEQDAQLLIETGLDKDLSIQEQLEDSGDYSAILPGLPVLHCLYRYDETVKAMIDRSASLTGHLQTNGGFVIDDRSNEQIEELALYIKEHDWQS